MKQTFVYRDEKSSKFWNINVTDNCFTVTFGRLGTVGQTQEKSFTDETTCRKEADKLIAEKRKKGYVEQFGESEDRAAAAGNEYREEWEKIVNVADKPQALTEHFSYLADTPGQEETLRSLLRQIMNKCTDVKIEDDTLVMIFNDDSEITASAPLENINPKYPQTFQAVLRKHEHIHWEENMFDLWNEIYVDNIGLQDDDLAEYGIKSVCTLTGCIWDYSDCWFFHPKKKNSYGEAVACVP
jgi:predicted DNA-binding WGR domain protein